jgi:hypothetical protein
MGQPNGVHSIGVNAMSKFRLFALSVLVMAGGSLMLQQPAEAFGDRLCHTQGTECLGEVCCITGPGQCTTSESICEAFCEANPEALTCM